MFTITCHYTAVWFLQSLDEQDFGEKKEINKRKKLILEGKVSEAGISLHLLLMVSSSLYVSHIFVTRVLLSLVFRVVFL